MQARFYELVAPRQIELRNQRLEAAPGAGEILAITEFSIISPGTELAAWTGQPPLRPSQVYPRLVGYCNVASIAAVGPGVTGLTVGDHVLTHQSHRTAFICPAAEILLTFPPATTEARRRHLATTYLYHLAHVALLRGRFAVGQPVAIVGFGTLGVATAALVRARGGEPLVYSDQPVDAKLAQLVSGPARPKQAAVTAPVAELVINTSNRWPDHWLSLQLARHGGHIVCLGFPGRGQPLPDFNPLDSRYFYDRQLSLHHCGHVADHATLQRNLADLAGLIARGALDPETLLSFDTPWTDLAATYARLEQRGPGILTACLRWS